MRRAFGRWSVGLALVAGASCSAPSKTSTAPEPGERSGLAVPKPWTERFQKAGVLVANEVRIEGPRGLLDHCVVRHDDDHVVSAETRPEGFLQTFSQSSAGGGEIRAQLDNVVISVLQRLVVLERPGPVDVVITAAGDAYWRDVESGAEQRAPTLRIEGHVVR